jgi:hypothetical protein
MYSYGLNDYLKGYDMPLKKFGDTDPLTYVKIQQKLIKRTDDITDIIVYGIYDSQALHDLLDKLMYFLTIEVSMDQMNLPLSVILYDTATSKNGCVVS